MSLFRQDCLPVSPTSQEDFSKEPSVCVISTSLPSYLLESETVVRFLATHHPLPDPVMDSVLYLSYSVSGTDKAALETLPSLDFYDTSPF